MDEWMDGTPTKTKCPNLSKVKPQKSFQKHVANISKSEENVGFAGVSNM